MAESLWCVLACSFDQSLARAVYFPSCRLQLLTLLCGVAQGILRGFDQATNMILDECHERVYSSKVQQG